MNLKCSTALILFALSACGVDKGERPPADKAASSPVPPALFALVPPSRSGVLFHNNIQETNEGNFSRFQYMYNGNGVAVGDVNNDGLPDLYITGNQVSDRLYLNQGGMKFLDITGPAGLENGIGWKTGVTMVDIDADGDLDIHVARSGWITDPELRRNLLYINTGKDQGGIPRFEERAAQWGIDDPAYSVLAAFTDLDGDGDLDMYLSNHPVDYKQTLGERLERMRDPDHMVTDRLYRNDGDHFTDVSLAGGIHNYGHGLGLMFWDINGDGLDDIYVANDFQTPDLLYINLGGMRFREALREHFPHVSYFSMGMDINDVDNDGDNDLFVVEMLPWEYERTVMNLADMDEVRAKAFLEKGFYHQVMRNVFQMDQGNGHFSDVAWITGTADTDWSWTALFSDLDNDGWKDLLVTNGYLRDTQDRDYKKKEGPFLEEMKGRLTLKDLETICKSVKIPNRLYRNHGGRRFEEVGAAWGLPQKAFSYGAASADLDLDGDLDLIIANTNLTLAPDPTFIYENLSVQQGKGHWSRLRFEGPPKNPVGEGVRVEVHAGGMGQWQQLRTTRGFQSSMEQVVHFGLGAATRMDSMIVRWPDGRTEVRFDVPADTVLLLRHADAGPSRTRPKPEPTLFAEVKDAGLSHVHRESDFDDLLVQPGLPERISRGGPCSAVADVNGDGRMDVFLGGGAGQAPALFLGGAQGRFTPSRQPAFVKDAAFEDRCAVFLDVDQDGDQDLYIGSGSTEFPAPAMLRDRLYINTNGSFVRNDALLPELAINTGAVVAADVDGDGDDDLFVGGRSVPGGYPAAPRSHFLRNDAGTFHDATAEWAPGSERPGMVTAAAFADVDADGDSDLVLALDWGPLRVLRNDGGRFSDATSTLLDKAPSGWWRSLHAGDVDGDGDVDLVAGNHGLNDRYSQDREHPVRLYNADMDHDGRSDLVVARWIENGYRPDESFTLLQVRFPFLGKKYEWYETYAKQDMVRIFGVDAERAEVLDAETFASVWYRNDGGRYTLQELPWEAQLSTVNAMTPVAWSDGTGLLIAGNTRHAPIEVGNSDASVGLLLRFDGQGGSFAVDPRRSGVYLTGDVRSMVAVPGNNGQLVVVGNNDGPVQVLKGNSPPPVPAPSLP